MDAGSTNIGARHAQMSYSASMQSQQLTQLAVNSPGRSLSVTQLTSQSVSVGVSWTASAAAPLAQFDQLLRDAYSRISGMGPIESPSASATGPHKTPLNAYSAQEPLTAQKVANNILGFIERRLTQDIKEGATFEQLESRLAAGLKGFEQGFAEAQEQLKALASFNATVEAEIGDTYNRVIKGFEDFRVRFLDNWIAPNTDKTLASENTLVSGKTAAPGKTSAS